jgi:uncharacterized protein (DUF169 family)
MHFAADADYFAGVLVNGQGSLPPPFCGDPVFEATVENI